MSTNELLILTFVLAGILFFVRVLPVTLFANSTLPVIIQKWLKYIPPSILSALVVSEILVKDNQIYFSFSNLFLIAAFPTFLVAYKTKSLFMTLIFGMLCMMLIRYGVNYV